MNNFNFHNPVKILFGKGKISEISKEIPPKAKLLITYGGGSILNNGILTQVTQALEGFEYKLFGGIEPNPRYETLMKAVKQVKENNIDFMLAVGGGSVIDGTKFIAAAACYQNENPWNIVKKREPLDKAIAFGTVLTLPATGSEMNSGAVITKADEKEKFAFGSPLLYPVFSVLDPSFTASLPPKQAANGVVDAFVHVMEQYLTYDTGNSLLSYFAESVLKTLIDYGYDYYQNPADYQAAGNIMWAATWALNGLIGAGVPQDWTSHMIGHELTALHNIDHARTLAIVLPGVMTVLKEDKSAMLLRFAKNIWNITDSDEEKSIAEAIYQTEHFFNQLGIKTRLKDYDIGNETIAAIVHRFSTRNWLLGEHKTVTPEIVRTILESRL